MKILYRLSLRQKIISIILAVTIISIITMFTIDILDDYKTSRNELINNSTLYAKLTADYLLPTFLSEDQSGVKDVLQQLRNNPAIIYGAAYDTVETLYAEYG